MWKCLLIIVVAVFLAPSFMEKVSDEGIIKIYYYRHPEMLRSSINLDCESFLCSVNNLNYDPTVEYVVEFSDDSSLNEERKQEIRDSILSQIMYYFELDKIDSIVLSNPKQVVKHSKRIKNYIDHSSFEVSQSDRVFFVICIETNTKIDTIGLDRAPSYSFTHHGVSKKSEKLYNYIVRIIGKMDERWKKEFESLEMKNSYPEKALLYD